MFTYNAIVFSGDPGPSWLLHGLSEGHVGDRNSSQLNGILGQEPLQFTRSVHQTEGGAVCYVRAGAAGVVPSVALGRLCELDN